MRNNIIKYICFAAFWSCLMWAASSCQPLSGDQRPIAKVGDKYLYMSDLSEIFTQKYSRDDSLVMAKLFIDNWIKRQLLLQRAELNLSKEQLNISKEIENYRSSLLIHKYEEQMLSSKLDTSVSNKEIEAYYNDNTANFILDDYVVRGMFLKIPADVPDLDNVRKWYASGKEQDMESLTQYCYRHAGILDHFNDDWVLWSTITAELPRAVDDKDLQRNQIEQHNAEYVYFVSIKEKKAPGDAAPLTVTKTKIKNIILNKRKLLFISDLENSVYTEALRKKQFETYSY